MFAQTTTSSALPPLRNDSQSRKPICQPRAKLVMLVILKSALGSTASMEDARSAELETHLSTRGACASKKKKNLRLQIRCTYKQLAPQAQCLNVAQFLTAGSKIWPEPTGSFRSGKDWWSKGSQRSKTNKQTTKQPNNQTTKQPNNQPTNQTNKQARHHVSWAKSGPESCGRDPRNETNFDVANVAQLCVSLM